MGFGPRVSGVVMLGLISLSCQLPPDRGASTGTGTGIQTGQRTSNQNMSDQLATSRASCTFLAGALTTDTLPLTEAQREAIPIKHVVILMKENRSFDHLLGALNTFGQAAVSDVPLSFTNSDLMGTAVGPFHFDTTCVGINPGHQWNPMHQQVHGGAMDGFVQSAADTTATDGHLTHVLA